MTKADIFSGFLGAGKTTLIKKLIAEAYKGEKLVLIENEFGDIGIDGGFMKEAGIEVNEMNSGCICCSLVGDFHAALTKVLDEYKPDRILIEPSGVGKLSDIIRAVEGVEGLEINSATAVADAAKCRMYAKNFGEFYDDQIRHAGAIVLSRTDSMSEEKLEKCIALLRERNPEAVIITTPWPELSGKDIQAAIERTETLEKELEELSCEHEHHHHDDECCGHEHHHHHDGDCCEHEHHHDDDCCGHEHHHHDDECCEHEHHHNDGDCCEHEHHHHDGDCCGHEHHHHHDDECCGHEHHHHDGDCCGHDHHHHDADEVFISWGVETPKKFTAVQLEKILSDLDDAEAYGIVLRAKGIVDAEDGQWLHFDHVPGEADVRRGAAAVTGRLCVIGSGLKTDALKALFGV